MPERTLCRKYFSNATLATWTQRPLEAQLTLRGGFCGMATKATPEGLPRPDFWGGFRLWLNAVELWIEGRDRFHERVRYERRLDARDAYTFETGRWQWQRLQP